MRVADLKTRAGAASRASGPRRGPATAAIVVTDYLKPDLDEIYGMLPDRLVAPVRALGRAPLAARAARPSASTCARRPISGFLRVWLLARLKPLRPISYRAREEHARIDALARRGARPARRPTPRWPSRSRGRRQLVKGYGDVRRRMMAVHEQIVARRRSAPCTLEAASRQGFAVSTRAGGAAARARARRARTAKDACRPPSPPRSRRLETGDLAGALEPLAAASCATAASADIELEAEALERRARVAGVLDGGDQRHAAGDLAHPVGARHALPRCAPACAARSPTPPAAAIRPSSRSPPSIFSTRSTSGRKNRMTDSSGAEGALPLPRRPDCGKRALPPRGAADHDGQRRATRSPDCRTSFRVGRLTRVRGAAGAGRSRCRRRASALARCTKEKADRVALDPDDEGDDLDRRGAVGRREQQLHRRALGQSVAPERTFIPVADSSVQTPSHAVPLYSTTRTGKPIGRTRAAPALVRRRLSVRPAAERVRLQERQHLVEPLERHRLADEVERAQPQALAGLALGGDARRWPRWAAPASRTGRSCRKSRPLMPGRLMSRMMASGRWRCSAPSAASALRTTTASCPISARKSRNTSPRVLFILDDEDSHDLPSSLARRSGDPVATEEWRARSLKSTGAPRARLPSRRAASKRWARSIGEAVEGHDRARGLAPVEDEVEGQVHQCRRSASPTSHGQPVIQATARQQREQLVGVQDQDGAPHAGRRGSSAGTRRAAGRVGRSNST